MDSFKFLFVDLDPQSIPKRELAILFLSLSLSPQLFCLFTGSQLFNEEIKIEILQ